MCVSTPVSVGLMVGAVTCFTGGPWFELRHRSFLAWMMIYQRPRSLVRYLRIKYSNYLLEHLQ